ncbi:ATP synthase protein I [Glaciimonas immobilis]|uniref:ATP synthase protein I n=2 Tax=Glaciimonas immobilis TaxID=728004 RepID=A0A840RT72_9BURK|nr:ATP synthase protein I [Glaciimonas immobilis]
MTHGIALGIAQLGIDMLRIVLLQFIVTVVVAGVAALLGGMPGFISALLGGLCCAVPNGLFALRLFFSARKPGGANPISFFIGEFIKIATTVALLGAVVWLYHGVNWLAFVVSFIVVLKSYFILLFRRQL